MSLDFDCRNIKDYKEACYKKNEDGTYTIHPLFQATIFYSMLVDIGEISDKTIPIWKKRSKMLALIGLQVADYEGKPYLLTNEDYQTWKGLTLNVVTLSDAQWYKKFIKIVQEKANRTWPNI